MPTARLHTSFLAAMSEFVAEGCGAAEDASLLGRDLRAHGPGSSANWSDPRIFAAYVAQLCADRFEGSPRPEGFVPSTVWWWTQGDTYLGRIQVRHRLTEYLLNAGGHVGYDVRPSARLRGHATAMLRAILPAARAMQPPVDRLLVTCERDNIGSRRVIERCGGVFEDQRGSKLRYWLGTSD